MAEKGYYELVSSMVTDSLLHLYLTVSETTRYTPKIKRNEILVRFLKPKLKDKNYQAVKVEIKRLLTTGRHKNGDLENQLLNVNSSVLAELDNVTDSQKLFDLLEDIRVKHNVHSRFIMKNEKRKPKFIYLLQSHIEHGFDKKGNQVAPISLFWESPRYTALEMMINETGLFKAITEDINEEHTQIHVVLHPLNF